MIQQKTTRWLAGPMVVGLAMGTTSVVLHAEGMEGGPGGSPTGGPPPTNGDRPSGDRPDFRNMTPEQREQQMQKMREQGLRRMLTESGFTQTATQDAVVAFVNAQDEATQSLRYQARKLSEAMRDNTFTDAQIAPLLADFRATAAQEKTRRANALKDLDAKIGYSTKPRLDAALMMAGVIGDEASLLGGAGGPGGGRGMGNGQGNGRGGRGGQGGGQGGAQGGGRDGGPGGDPFGG